MQFLYNHATQYPEKLYTYLELPKNFIFDFSHFVTHKFIQMGMRSHQFYNNIISLFYSMKKIHPFGQLTKIFNSIGFRNLSRYLLGYLWKQNIVHSLKVYLIVNANVRICKKSCLYSWQTNKIGNFQSNPMNLM